MSDIAYIIRGVLIQVADARLLLPNATIAEVLSYAAPEPLEDAPDWLLGRIRWRGWQLPLVSFARFAGIAEEQGSLGSKVIVLKALGGNPQNTAVLRAADPGLPAAGDGDRADPRNPGGGRRAARRRAGPRSPERKTTRWCLTWPRWSSACAALAAAA